MLVQRMRYFQEQAAAKLQKWLLLCESTSKLRNIRHVRACLTVQRNLRMRQARQTLLYRRRHRAARRLQFFWCVVVTVRRIPWRRRRQQAATVLQTCSRSWKARRRVASVREATNLRNVQMHQAASLAASMVAGAYRGKQARRCRQRLEENRLVQEKLAPIILSTIVTCLARRTVSALRQQRRRELEHRSALHLQTAYRQHVARGMLVHRRREQVVMHVAAFTLGAAARRALCRRSYRRRLSGDATAECLQRSWRCRRARLAAAASKLVPFFERAAASRVTTLLLVRLAERRQGLPPGTICLHCLIGVAGGHTTLPCTASMTQTHRGSLLPGRPDSVAGDAKDAGGGEEKSPNSDGHAAGWPSWPGANAPVRARQLPGL